MTLRPLILALAALSTTFCSLAHAQEARKCASASDRACISALILDDAGSMQEAQWRDQALRDIATSLTYDNKTDEAISQIARIGNPDTQAMTIRAIGMTAALYSKNTPEQLRAIFTKLETAAAGITQPAASAIAQTYIAMAQAFAGMDEDAWQTAAAMTNAALKHKAYGETAEIQAERGDITRAMQSIEKIDATSYRNKTYQNIAAILIKKSLYDSALDAAQRIDNPAKRAQTLQTILRAQEEKARGTRNDKANGSVPE